MKVFRNILFGIMTLTMVGCTVEPEVERSANEAAKEVGEAAKATGEAAAEAAREAAPIVTDAGITAAVKTRLLADPDVSGMKIDVDTKDKLVTLKGSVASAAQASKAERLAAATPGVTRVVNELKVNAAQ